MIAVVVALVPGIVVTTAVPIVLVEFVALVMFVAVEFVPTKTAAVNSSLVGRSATLKVSASTLSDITLRLSVPVAKPSPWIAVKAAPSVLVLFVALVMLVAVEFVPTKTAAVNSSLVGRSATLKVSASTLSDITLRLSVPVAKPSPWIAVKAAPSVLVLFVALVMLVAVEFVPTKTAAVNSSLVGRSATLKVSASTLSDITLRLSVPVAKPSPWIAVKAAPSVLVLFVALVMLVAVEFVPTKTAAVNSSLVGRSATLKVSASTLSDITLRLSVPVTKPVPWITPKAAAIEAEAEGIAVGSPITAVSARISVTLPCIAIISAEIEAPIGSPKIPAIVASPPVFTGVPTLVSISLTLTLIVASLLTIEILAVSPKTAANVASPPEFKGVPSVAVSTRISSTSVCTAAISAVIATRLLSPVAKPTPSISVKVLGIVVSVSSTIELTLVLIAPSLLTIERLLASPKTAANVAVPKVFKGVPSVAVSARISVTLPCIVVIVPGIVVVTAVEINFRPSVPETKPVPSIAPKAAAIEAEAEGIAVGSPITAVSSRIEVTLPCIVSMLSERTFKLSVSVSKPVPASVVRLFV